VEVAASLSPLKFAPLFTQAKALEPVIIEVVSIDPKPPHKLILPSSPVPPALDNPSMPIMVIMIDSVPKEVTAVSTALPGSVTPMVKAVPDTGVEETEDEETIPVAMDEVEEIIPAGMDETALLLVTRTTHPHGWTPMKYLWFIPYLKC
jgi:hypothetical protein